MVIRELADYLFRHLVAYLQIKIIISFIENSNKSLKLNWSINKMTNIVPLNNKHHAKLKIKDNKDFSRFKDQHLIPITVQDFIPLSTEFPIVFVKNAETGQFTAVAMMGIKTNINLYCQTSEWLSEVTPSSFFNSPLGLVKQEGEEENFYVCIDINENGVGKIDGQSLFDEKGEETEYLKVRTKHLLDVAENSQQTQNIIQYLASKKILTLRTLNLNLAGEKYTIEGLYVIDEKVLHNLNNEDFNELRERGLLPLIYAHLSSMHQIARLITKQLNFDRSK